MTKLGKLTRLKSAMKRWPSLSKLGRNNCTVPTMPHEEEGSDRVEGDRRARSVYVGKSRRRYNVSTGVFGHPIFKELLEKSSWWEDSYKGGEGRLVVACEVVLFEHLVWMLENEDDDDAQLGSMDELVGFYTC